jgi:drug/metabolite transporter (DMT)-like permease
MSAWIVIASGRETSATVRKIGWPGLLVAGLSALAALCYLHALRLTTVAEVMAINASSRLISGTLAWLILKERERWQIVMASITALAGVAIMVGPGVLSRHVAGFVRQSTISRASFDFPCSAAEE